jgi:hypothetical protein
MIKNFTYKSMSPIVEPVQFENVLTHVWKEDVFGLI